LSLLDLNVRNIPELESVGISLVKTINPKDVHFMGHSFGGATCLTAAVRRPDLVVSIVAHEPVLDWMPDDARRALFEPERVKGAPREYEGGTGGFESSASSPSSNGKQSIIHDRPMLFLYSAEWKSKGWGSSDILEYMHQQGKLGRRGSDFGVIPESHHNEFSDTSKLTPVWLGRMVGVTGKRSPLETGEEIKERTLAFLELVRQQRQ
jgi:pimeloyl-ACP methyl ester carboxylesterase